MGSVFKEQRKECFWVVIIIVYTEGELEWAGSSLPPNGECMKTEFKVLRTPKPQKEWWTERGRGHLLLQHSMAVRAQHRTKRYSSTLQLESPSSTSTYKWQWTHHLAALIWAISLSLSTFCDKLFLSYTGLDVGLQYSLLAPGSFSVLWYSGVFFSELCCILTVRQLFHFEKRSYEAKVWESSVMSYLWHTAVREATVTVWKLDSGEFSRPAALSCKSIKGRKSSLRAGNYISISIRINCSARVITPFAASISWWQNRPSFIGRAVVLSIPRYHGILGWASGSCVWMEIDVSCCYTNVNALIQNILDGQRKNINSCRLWVHCKYLT